VDRRLLSGSSCASRNNFAGGAGGSLWAADEPPRLLDDFRAALFRWSEGLWDPQAGGDRQNDAVGVNLMSTTDIAEQGWGWRRRDPGCRIQSPDAKPWGTLIIAIGTNPISGDQGRSVFLSLCSQAIWAEWWRPWWA
jgi:hypothetical protein